MVVEIFGNLNRSAIGIEYKKPFLDWLNSRENNLKFDPTFHESNIYLLPDFETKDEIEKWLMKNYDQLFAQELFAWYIDESYWPQNRTFNLFREWFDYSLHTMIFDTLKSPIKKF